METSNILFKKDAHTIKNRKHIRRNVLIIYSPTHIKIEPASYRRIDNEIVVFLPDKLKEILESEQRLWIEILNKSFDDNIVILKKNLSVFL